MPREDGLALPEDTSITKLAYCLRLGSAFEAAAFRTLGFRFSAWRAAGSYHPTGPREDGLALALLSKPQLGSGRYREKGGERVAEGGLPAQVRHRQHRGGVGHQRRGLLAALQREQLRELHRRHLAHRPLPPPATPRLPPQQGAAIGSLIGVSLGVSIGSKGCSAPAAARRRAAACSSRAAPPPATTHTPLGPSCGDGPLSVYSNVVERGAVVCEPGQRPSSSARRRDSRRRRRRRANFSDRQ
jgi:hypothetical protein